MFPHDGRLNSNEISQHQAHQVGTEAPRPCNATIGPMAHVNWRTFGSPGRYVQGPGALHHLGALAEQFDGSPIVVTDSAVMDVLGTRLMNLAWASAPRLLMITGDITYAAIDRLADECQDVSPAVVIGFGGGKALDSAKALSVRLNVPVITVPTIASNDSPTSSAIAMYDDNHHLVSVDMMAANPHTVLVDTELISQAPPHFLRSGIGDAVAKVFEAEGCAQGTGLTPLGTRPLRIALAIGMSCYETLRADAQTALADCAEGRLSDPVERVVEAVVLMSGLAFENGGLSLAHSLTRGLMRVKGAKDLPHGYHVAWGALVQIQAEGRGDDEVLDLAKFLTSVGLPVCSGDLGLVSPWPEQHSTIARYTMTAPHLANLSVEVDETRIVAAIERVDALVALGVN